MKPPKYHRMFSYDKRLLPNAHLATLEEGVTTIDEAQKKTGLTIGYPGWGLLYHILLSHLDRSREEILIETGTNVGCTSIILAQALIDAECAGKLLTFELDENNAIRARENFNQAKVSGRIELFTGDVRETLPGAIKQYSGIRFAYLDASHLYEDVLFEFETVKPHLAPDAVVVFDNTWQLADTGEDQRVNGALGEITRRYGGNLINFEYVSWFTPGLAIWQEAPAL